MTKQILNYIVFTKASVAMKNWHCITTKNHQQKKTDVAM